MSSTVAAMKKRKQVKWATEEDGTVLKMRDEDGSWGEIHDALSHRTSGTIQAYCYDV
jgi:hypothetical protein